MCAFDAKTRLPTESRACAQKMRQMI